MKSSNEGSHEQLQLPLAWSEPWEGWSPRSLTKARVLTSSAKPLYLRPEPPRHEVDMDPDQLEMWPAPVSHTEKMAPELGSGASLLSGSYHRQSRFTRSRRV